MFNLIHTLCPGGQKSYLYLGIFLVLKFLFVYDVLIRTITGQYIIAYCAHYVTRITVIDKFNDIEQFKPTTVSMKRRLKTK